MQTEAFQLLEMVQEVKRREGVTLRTTRCPIRIDGLRLKSGAGAPVIGQHTATIADEFGLQTAKEHKL
jgi:CoA:oxalate CoA-transferase